MRDKEIISSEEELIEHFQKQIDRHDKNTSGSDLTLRMGYIEIDCYFEFENILKGLKIKEKDENRIIYPYKVEFNNIIFSQDVNFSFIAFSQNLVFITTTFNKDVRFYHTTFSQELIFWDTTFNQDITFRYTTFEQDTYFSNTTFEKEALFFDIELKQKISFDNIKMSLDKNYLTFRNIYYDNTTKKFLEAPKDSSIEIKNTIIDKRIDFNDVHIAKLDLQGSNVTSILNRINLKAKSKNWQTACILKNEELKRNNTIKALEYHAEEKKLYMKELRSNLSWLGWKDFFIWLERLGDWFSLCLGKNFHNHGQNWGLALWWTLVVWILCFSIFYLPNPCKYWYYWVYLFEKGIYTAELFQYFVPTNYDQIIEYVKISELDLPIKFGGVLAYILGKIFVPYGIFEIIKAFRKYR